MRNFILGGVSLLLLFLGFVNIGTPVGPLYGAAAMFVLWIKLAGDKRALARLNAAGDHGSSRTGVE